MKTKHRSLINSFKMLAIVLTVMLTACNKDETENIPSQDENKAPKCEIVNPQQQEIFNQGEVIQLVVEASDIDGNIKEIRFYANAEGIGVAKEFPYKYEWNTSGIDTGAYLIQAEAWDEKGATTNDEVEISLVKGPGGEMPIAAFKADTTRVGIGQNVQFTDLSQNDPTTWLWNFGDGSSSTLQNPSKVFDQEGKYSITLIVSNNYGTDTEIKSEFITVVQYQINTYTDPRDGQTYDIVTIGEDTWFAENLNYDAGEGCMYYNNSPSMGNEYGMLYKFNTAKEVCPDGWHLSTDYEWSKLEAEIGMTQNQINQSGWRGNAGNKLKSENWYGNNESGFNALGAGTYANGSFSSLDWFTFFWTTNINATRGLVSDDSEIGRLDIFGSGEAISVRCVKD